MTVGEILNAFPWVAPVEVWTPCGVDGEGDQRFECAWSQTLILDQPDIPGEIAEKEIQEAAVLHVPNQRETSTVTLQFYTK